MADPSRDPSLTAGPIQPMLARLRGTVAALPPAEEPRKVPPSDIPMATPVTGPSE